MALPMDRKRAENALVRLALRELRALLGEVVDDDPKVVAAVVREHFPDLVARYGEVAATMAADHFEDVTGLPARMVRPVDAERTQGDLNYALAPLFTAGDFAGRLDVLLDKLVRQPGRSTIYGSVRDHEIRYARVPVGDTCAFCLMLASRGDVYLSAKTAGDKGNRYHGFCDCQIEPIRYDEDLDALKADAGYDPDELYDRYLVARGEAESGSAKSILAEMRKLEGSN